MGNSNALANGRSNQEKAHYIVERNVDSNSQKWYKMKP